jgi:hypothetical protein
MIVELMIRKCSDGTYEVVIPCVSQNNADRIVEAFNQARQEDREFERLRYGREMVITTAERVEGYLNTARRVYARASSSRLRGKSP